MTKSYRHNQEKRAHIPSKEEAGYEKENPKVKEQGDRLQLPVNPIIHRGRDPELFWMDKYNNDQRIRELLDELAKPKVKPEIKSLIEELRSVLSDPSQSDWIEMLDIDIRSLYRTEHIAPELLIQGLTKLVEEESTQEKLFSVNELFGNSLNKDELSKVSEYYEHSDGWSNRMILGDSLRVMTSLLEREGMAGQVQMVYIDPPYGIKYDGNWQLQINDRNVRDGKDEHLTEEPEQIKAYRDTWEKGIHSYLTYMRERILIGKELLNESGSCFIQISDENLHLIRNLLDEVFGSENFISVITFKKTGGMGQKLIDNISDYLIWYAKDKESVKYRQLYQYKSLEDPSTHLYNKVVDKGNLITLSKDEVRRKWDNNNFEDLIQLTSLVSESGGEKTAFEVEYKGEKYKPSGGYWKTNKDGFKRLLNLNRVEIAGKTLRYVRYLGDFPVTAITNLWEDMGGAANKRYVVQTNEQIIKRCLLMTTDPGDLVIDPTCGSGTTAYLAEEWGRRWITIDTSRIALNIAKTRLMTATYSYYYLYSEVNIDRTKTKDGKIKKTLNYKPKSEKIQDTRQGFVYEEVPHIKLQQLANDEEPETEILYDKPFEDFSKMRVAGPFTVETLQNLNPVHPDKIEEEAREEEGAQKFEDRVFESLKSAGIKNGIKQEQAVFTQVNRLPDTCLHAEGYYDTGDGERKAYLHIGPKFGTVSNQSVNEAIKECRAKGDGDWLVIMGFSFESEITNQTVTTSMGNFEVTKVRMADDLLQDGLLKSKKDASFITIGEPDIELLGKEEGRYQIEVLGIDIYDPIKDEVKPRNAKDIGYWMLDDNYDGSNFVVRQVFFSGGNGDEFKDMKKDLQKLEKRKHTKKNVEHTLRIKIDDEAFDRLYGLKSHPFEAEEGQKVAVRVVSQFGEEVTKVINIK